MKTTTLAHVRAFLLGARQFRSSFTDNLGNDDLMRSYDWGREIAHRVTLRRFDA